MRKKFGKSYYFNCFLAVSILLLKNRLGGVLIVYKLWDWPHLLGITKAGNVIHFKTTGEHDFCLPWVFEGNTELVRAELFRRKRNVVWFQWKRLDITKKIRYKLVED